MTELRIYRGLPASGKTTLAKEWVAEDAAHRARVNRDDLRAMCHAGVYLGHETERSIMAVRDTAITALLRRGISVASDDTNLSQKVARGIAKLARSNGAEIEIVDLTDVDPVTCITRDAAREHPVGAKVIRDMHDRYLGGKQGPLPFPEEEEGNEGDGGSAVAYVPKSGMPKAILVDIDGTAALKGDRSPFDWSRVSEDTVNEPVRTAVLAATAYGLRVIYCSGRMDSCREDTKRWLKRWIGAEFELLLMRAEGDMRRDAIVKAELFDEFIRDHYDIQYVLDDRDQVVSMWRNLGLAVFQVAPGNF